MYVRASSTFSGQPLVTATQAAVNDDRAASVRFRIANENLLIQKALEKKLLGWARWGRSRGYKLGKDVTITDGLWIIVFGTSGLLGLISLNAMLVLPGIVLWRPCPRRYWRHLTYGPA